MEKKGKKKKKKKDKTEEKKKDKMETFSQNRCAESVKDQRDRVVGVYNGFD